MMFRPRTYIYAGPGAGQTSVKALERSLRLFGIYRITRIDWRDLASFPSRASAKNSLLCVPGGRDLPLINRLRPQSVWSLKNFVARGGTYFGVCSGAYFASADLDFAASTSLCIKEARPLRFFRGTARGPTHNLKSFSYRHDAMGCLAAIKSGQDVIPAYTLGGCALVGSQFTAAQMHQADSIILARYGPEADHAPAARLEKVGCGRALLVGLHLEWEKQDLPNALARRLLGAQLDATRASRMRLLHGWLRCALMQ